MNPQQIQGNGKTSMRGGMLAGMMLVAGTILAACGGGGGGATVATAGAGGSGTQQVACTNPPARLTGVQTGTMQVAVLYKSYDGLSQNPVPGVYVMIDDGGPSAVTDACGYVTFSGLAAGPHDVFVFGDAAGPVITGGYAIAQTDQAHVEVPISVTDYGAASSLYTTGTINGNSTVAEFHYDGGKVAVAKPAAGGGNHTTVFALDKPQGASVTGQLIFRKWFTDGTNVSTTDAFDAGQVTLTTSDILGLFNRVDNVVDVSFATTPPALNLTVSYNGTPSPNIAGINRMYVFPSFNRAMESVPYHGRTGYELVMDPVSPFALNMYSLPSDQLYMVAIGNGANTGAVTDVYPGDAWTVVEPVPANGAVSGVSSFTVECNTTVGQTGTTFTFTPATGTVTYHRLDYDLTASNGTTYWHVWLPDTATSFTLPANPPAGAYDPAALAVPGATAKVRLSCVDAGGMTYAQFTSGGSLFGKRIEEYKLYTTATPY